jgi:hypothetical protein
LTRRDNLKAGLFDAPRQRRKYPLQRINPQSIFTRSRPPDLFILIVAPPIQIVAPQMTPFSAASIGLQRIIWDDKVSVQPIDVLTEQNGA